MLSHIELDGNRVIQISGCKGVLEYTDTSVKIYCIKMVAEISGEKLRIRFLGDDTTEIYGNIFKIEFKL